ncbi:hypothetical protein RUM43_013449 [Polyplax serrata]|uniref:Uncharacterized protein n=1 Tax=Polyplax serrata TaxID=468196 RepID=A0AAN8PHZ3_POLSC
MANTKVDQDLEDKGVVMVRAYGPKTFPLSNEVRQIGDHETRNECAEVNKLSLEFAEKVQTP